MGMGSGGSNLSGMGSGMGTGMGSGMGKKGSSKSVVTNVFDDKSNVLKDVKNQGRRLRGL
jgi:hypothetical protein